MSSRSIGDVVRSLATEAAAAEVAQRDPEIRRSMAAEYEGRIVQAPDLVRQERERSWAARGIARRLWPVFHDGAPDAPVGPLAPKPTPALLAVSRFLSGAETRTALVLAGAVDTGKTLAAEWGAAWHGGAVVKGIDLVRAGLYPADQGFWPRLQGEKLLVIDDLGAEPLDAKGFGVAAICDLFDRRYDAARKTIITTNLPLTEFRDRYGTGAAARLWRRLVEVGRFIEIADRQPVSGLEEVGR